MELWKGKGSQDLQCENEEESWKDISDEQITDVSILHSLLVAMDFKCQYYFHVSVIHSKDRAAS